MFQAVVVFWLLLDFMTKQLVIQFMELRESIPLWEGIFHLTSVRNSGAAFSLLQGQFWVFYAAMVLLTVMVAWFWLSERPRHWMPVIGTALVMAGALGNTLDRLVLGAVVDMFDFRAINFAIFNVADIGITVGGALFAVWLVFLSGQIEWGRFLPGKRTVPSELVSVAAGSIAATTEKVSVVEPAQQFSLLERLELKLQKWETDIEREESQP